MAKTDNAVLQRVFSFRNFLIIAILGFALLTFFAKKNDYFNFDLSFTLFIQRLNVVWFDTLMRFVTFTGDEVPFAILIGLFSMCGYLIGKRKDLLVLFFSTFGGWIISKILKILVARPRPDPSLIHQIDHFIKADSFPSGHVLGAVSLYGFLLFIAYTQLKKGVFRNISISFCFLAIFLMGLSRIYLGAHWFSDVLGAYLLGFVWLSFMILIYQRLNPKVKPE